MIDIRNLSFHIGSFSLKDINLTIGDGEYFVILGPTGAGKTVFLECIAGLHHVKQGQIWINGREVTRLTPEERNLGYVPQDYVLFPFLNVVDNIGFGLRQTRSSKSEMHRRIKSLAELLGISPLLERDVNTLSGGEKQRVALARALATSPRILLLDEPLSNLDLQTSKYLRLELLRIHRELGITIVHITHNQVEAEEMADRIAIINIGSLEQVGKPHDVFFYPENEIVSDFIGAMNILDCDSYRPLGNGLAEADCGGLRIILAHDGDSVRRIALFPRDIYVSDTQPPGPQINRFKGTITSIASRGATVRLEIKIGEKTLYAEMPDDIFGGMNLAVGKEVFLILKLRRMRVL
ncbi:MAG: ABC transporter ATP-binding protein [Chloroflexi bacterium]|nr:ABC transporter ATP-binding protein [Chloroflexota bacterium]